MIESAPKFNNKDIRKIFDIMVKLQSEGVLKSIQDDYFYWDKLKYKFKSEEYIQEDLWKAVKLHRVLNRKTQKFGNHSFNYLVTDYIQNALHQFDMHIGGTLGSNIGVAETDKTKFIISSIIEEAISSSQIEGAITTRIKAKKMIRQEQKPKNKSEQMIMNNFITMKHIVQNKNEDLTPEKTLYIHKLISTQTLDDPENGGRFRENDEIYVINYINGEVVHTPPSKSELKYLINDLCVFFNTHSKDFIHPIIKGCIIHFMIGWIHPFTDGNGRTARALFYWYMLKRGYWLTEYLSISRVIK